MVTGLSGPSCQAHPDYGPRSCGCREAGGIVASRLGNRCGDVDRHGHRSPPSMVYAAALDFCSTAAIVPVACNATSPCRCSDWALASHRKWSGPVLSRLRVTKLNAPQLPAVVTVDVDGVGSGASRRSAQLVMVRADAVGEPNAPLMAYPFRRRPRRR